MRAWRNTADRSQRSGGRLRIRWAAIGAAIAVSIGGGGVFVANAVAAVTPSSVVTIQPTRILDSRDPTNLGLAGPFVSKVPQKFLVAGGSPVPAGATGVLLNVTVVRATAAGFLSIRPGDATGPATTSSLNFQAGVTTPNAVQVALPIVGPDAGKIEIAYNASGVNGPTTDVLIDVVGYLTAASAGPAGPRGFSAWDVIPSGVTVRGQAVWDGHATPSTTSSDLMSVDLPGLAPVALGDSTVNFGTPGTADYDATCSGAVGTPTAPPGKVCIYLLSSGNANVSNLTGRILLLPTSSFAIEWTTSGVDNSDEYVYMSWAYTAP